LGEPGQVVPGQPEPARVAGVELQHDHPAGHPGHLGQAGERVSPVLIGQHAHRRVETLIGER